jgi:hypothetical protein
MCLVCARWVIAFVGLCWTIMLCSQHNATKATKAAKARPSPFNVQITTSFGLSSLTRLSLRQCLQEKFSHSCSISEDYSAKCKKKKHLEDQGKDSTSLCTLPGSTTSRHDLHHCCTFQQYPHAPCCLIPLLCYMHISFKKFSSGKWQPLRFQWARRDPLQEKEQFL